MNAGINELLCSKCRKRVSYHVCTRPATALIKDLEIEYEESYGICDECKAELYVPGIDDKNEELIDVEYRRRKGLASISLITALLKKYNIEKRPMSKLLGLGELTITRYIDGQLPSKRYSDILIDVFNNEQRMKMYAEKNKEAVSEGTYQKVFRAIESCEREKNFDSMAERVALYVIASGRDVTNLFLQKILYYVKAISFLFEGTSIIPEPCEAWKFGPVFPMVYEKYKEFGKQEISVHLSDDFVKGLLSDSEQRITDFVLNTFGIYNAWFLKDLTHCEKPWLEARRGAGESEVCRNVMQDDCIYDYFKQMNEHFSLKTSEGIDLYVTEMKRKMNRERYSE